MQMTLNNDFERLVFRYFDLGMKNLNVSDEEAENGEFERRTVERVALGIEIGIMIHSGNPDYTMDEYERQKERFARWWLCQRG